MQDAAGGCNVASRERRAEKIVNPQPDVQRLFHTCLSFESRISRRHWYSLEVAIFAILRSIPLGSTFAKPLRRNALASRVMALKHLLNYDNVDDFQHGSHSPHSDWYQHGSSEQYAMDGS